MSRPAPLALLLAACGGAGALDDSTAPLLTLGPVLTEPTLAHELGDVAALAAAPRPRFWDGRVASLSFGPGVPWGSPIADYIRTGTTALGARVFKRGIHDLLPQNDRLLLVYGDADRNLGEHTPIEIRSLLGAPAGVHVEITTDDNEVTTLRALDDGRVVAPGVDPVINDARGHLYVRASGAWTQRATIPDALHVHDFAAHGGSWYAVGSGRARGEPASLVHAYLWRSTDEGASFTTAARVSNDGVGDSRAFRTVVAGGELYVFGYKTGMNGRADRIANARWNGSALEPLVAPHPLEPVLVVDALAVADAALVRGMTSLATRKVGAWRIDAAGTTTFVEPIRGRTVIDFIYLRASGEVLVLTVDGDDFDDARTQWTARVALSEDGGVTFVELFDYVTNDRPRSLALWRQRLWVGTDGGALIQFVGALR